MKAGTHHSQVHGLSWYLCGCLGKPSEGTLATNCIKAKGQKSRDGSYVWLWSGIRLLPKKQEEIGEYGLNEEMKILLFKSRISRFPWFK